MRRGVGEDSFHAETFALLGLISAGFANLRMGLALDGLPDGQLDVPFQRQRLSVKPVLPPVSIRHRCSLSFYSAKWTSRTRRPNSVRAPWEEMPARFRV